MEAEFEKASGFATDLSLGQQLMLIEEHFAFVSPRGPEKRYGYLMNMETGSPVGSYNGDQPGEGIAMSDRAFVQTAAGLAARSHKTVDPKTAVSAANQIGRDDYWGMQTRTLRIGLQVTAESNLGGIPRYNEKSGAPGAFLNLSDKGETDALQAETQIELRPLRGTNISKEERANVLRALELSERVELAEDTKAAKERIYERYIKGVGAALPSTEEHEPTQQITTGGIHLREFILETNTSGLVVEHMPYWGGPHEPMGKTNASGIVRKVLNFNRYTMSTGRGTPQGHLIDPGEHVVSATNYSSATTAF